MSQYLAAHTRDSYLPPFGNCEGQMAPSVKKIMRNKPWDSSSIFDWQFIKKEWDKLAIDQNKSCFIECSPPNIMRVSSILDSFEDRQYIFSISSPYSFIASCIYNYFSARNGKIFKWRGMTYDHTLLKFNDIIPVVAKTWVKTALIQKNNIEAHGANKMRINYEDFCNNPIKLLELFNVDHLGDNAQTSLIKGKKNSNISEISNMLPKHLKFLRDKGILQINSILEKSMELMEWHGYCLISVEDAEDILAKNMVLALNGERRRTDFDEGIKSII